MKSGDQSISNYKLSMKTFLVNKKILISCSVRAEKAENQDQSLIVRVPEHQVRVNSQSRQNCYAKVKSWLGKNVALTYRMGTSG